MTDDDTRDRRPPARRGEATRATDPAKDVLEEALANAPPLDDLDAWAERDREIQARVNRERAGGQRAALEARGRQFVKDCGFPERAVDFAIAPERAQPFVAVSDWEPTRRKNILVLSGDQGIGKTVAACAFALRSAYATWRYARAAIFGSTSRYDREAHERITAGCLVLDDLGAEYVDGKGSFLADLDELVDFYYSRPSRQLVVTTNLSAELFKLRYPSERLLGRIREAAVWREFGAAACLRPAPKGGPK